MEIPTGASIPAHAMLFMKEVAMEAPIHKTAVIRYRFLDSPIMLMIISPNTCPSPLWFITAIIKLMPAQNRIICESRDSSASFGVTTVVRTATAIIAYPIKFGSIEITFRDFNTSAATNTRNVMPTTICFLLCPLVRAFSSVSSPKSS